MNISHNICYFRVEYFGMTTSTTGLLVSYMKRNSVSIPPIKLFYNGGMVISRQYKEQMSKELGGMAFVSLLYVYHNLYQSSHILNISVITLSISVSLYS